MLLSSALTHAPAVDLLQDLPAQLSKIADAVAAQITTALDESENAATDLRVGVSYSGGVDSSVLATLVARAVGRERTVLLLGDSASLARREKSFALRQAKQLDLAVVEVVTRELENPNYASNPVNRCYFCKDELYNRFDEGVLDAHRVGPVVYGENLDDAARIDRPGGRAAREHGVLYPLATASATKADVRSIARAFGLISADKPAAPCLASRIPHGQAVTAQKLKMIDLAEDAVLRAGFSDCRVRHHGDLARVEVPTEEFDLLLDQHRKSALVNEIKAAGFKHVTLDLEGIRSGAFTLSILNAGKTTRGHDE
ncbi:MAG: ATP-dependent sacrificial sulfur transferase LarE [Actinomycetaceae bacterium]|nr:ATP-dependent sacrificial sulfur transferase LarE [Actinomycetaceae bacterium]